MQSLLSSVNVLSRYIKCPVTPVTTLLVLAGFDVGADADADEADADADELVPPPAAEGEGPPELPLPLLPVTTSPRGTIAAITIAPAIKVAAEIAIMAKKRSLFLLAGGATGIRYVLICMLWLPAWPPCTPWNSARPPVSSVSLTPFPPEDHIYPATTPFRSDEGHDFTQGTRIVTKTRKRPTLQDVWMQEGPPEARPEFANSHNRPSAVRTGRLVCAPRSAGCGPAAFRSRIRNPLLEGDLTSTDGGFLGYAGLAIR